MDPSATAFRPTATPKTNGIAHLRGTLADKQPHEIILEVGGVGYRLFIPLSTYEKLPDPGETTQLFTITNVREDAFHLYGFASREEKEMFGFLNNVNGIGTKLALAALSTLDGPSLLTAISQGDVATLCRIPGVGKRTAQRLVVELRDRLPAPVPTAGERTVPTPSSAPPTSLREELVSALVNLGYKRAEAERAVRQTMTDETKNVGDGLRAALKVLVR